jgi:hypothetical protein
MDQLRGQVRRTIGDNVLAMGARPEKQWWNLPAKVAAGNRIGAEERARSIELDPDHNPHNDEFDAMRHARWSNRMATEIGPIFSRVAGAGHELENMLPSPERLAAYGAPRGLLDLARARQWHGESEAEALMDKRNNAEGRLAAAQGRAIDPRRLQTGLDRPPSGNPAYPQARPRGGGGGTR